MASFSIPLSGLDASSSELNVIGNNLANLNTDGYKDETLNFGDIFFQAQGASGNGDPIQIGSGVSVEDTSSNFANGAPTSTGVVSNMALQGNGFFVVETSSGGLNYTRNGDFTTNSSGQLVDANGDLVMGYPAVNGVVSQGAPLAPINVNSAETIPAVATTSFSANTNLQSGSPVGTVYNGTPITIYDSLGTPQTLDISYTNTGTNTWSYSVSVPGAATGAATPTTVATGTLTFNSDGVLTSPTGSVTGINITGLADGAAPMSLSWNLSSAGTPSITQVDSASATPTVTQNGFAAGTLTGYSVLANGTVEGSFSNDQTLALGQVAVGSFANDQGLTQTSGGDFQATSASGGAVIGVAGSGGDGTITGGAIEDSNVDLSTEFANMIVAQQSYEANAKVLTTLDQVSQATIQLVS
jgi:flagellar hook protein FlgE